MRSALFFPLLFTAEAVVLPFGLDPCDEAYEDIALTELNDGPTTSGEAGIGAEFETIGVQFTNDKCSLGDTFSAKGKTVQGISGLNFVLSVDTSVEQGKGKLSAEYVLDGRNIEVGALGSGGIGVAKLAGQAVRDQFMAWTPWTESPPDQITIENYPQCPDPWIVRGLDQDTEKNKINWAPQITTSMPLEAVYFLMQQNVLGIKAAAGGNILNGDTSGMRGQNIQLVTKDYFETLGSKVNLENINDAVLGFCSLVLSYAKAATKPINPRLPSDQEKSPKSWIPFMPRTEFITIYSAVKSFFPADDNELFDIFNILACYKTVVTNKEFEAVLDSDYCTGTVLNPVPGAKFGGLQYKYVGNFPQNGIPDTLSIKEWIEGIEKGGSSSDSLSIFDKNFDGSIGGLGPQVEKMFGLTRTAPLIEFRDLDPLTIEKFAGFMDGVDLAIQTLHRSFAARPIKRAKREASACPWSFAAVPTATPPPKPSCVVQDKDPGLGITSQGCICQGSSTWQALSTPSGVTYGAQCDYTASPSNNAQATITQAPMTPQTNSQACMVCTPLPNAEDECSSMPSCKPQTAYATATVNSSPVYYGTLSQDALFTGITTALKSACSSVTTSTSTISGKAIPIVACNTKDYLVSNQVPYTENGVLVNNGALSINVGSYASTTTQLNALLAVAGSMVAKSANSSSKSCHTMQYAEPIARPRGIFGRSVSLKLPFLFMRDHPTPSFSSIQVCNGPAVVVASYWAPGYRDRIGSGNQTPSPDAQLTATLKFSKGTDGEFICEVVAGLAGVILGEAAPELAEIDIFEAEQIEAACMELIE